MRIIVSTHKNTLFIIILIIIIIVNKNWRQKCQLRVSPIASHSKNKGLNKEFINLITCTRITYVQKFIMYGQYQMYPTRGTVSQTTHKHIYLAIPFPHVCVAHLLYLNAYLELWHQICDQKPQTAYIEIWL